MESKRIAAVGGGNMAEAIIRGAVGSGSVTTSGWVVAEPNADRRAIFADLGIDTVEHAADLTPHLGPDTQVLLAVKPQKLDEVAASGAELPLDRVVVSILAGATSTRIRDAFARAGSATATRMRVVRIMPNTPCGIGEGMTALCAGAGAAESDLSLAETLFGGLGRTVRLDESLMDAFTAVAGSGPAYLFLLAEAMIEGARSTGFPEEQAELIVRQTLAGASLLLRGSERGAADLRRAVTSPGGTTQAALEVMTGAGLVRTVADGIVAARDRGRVLSGG
ncbi:MAG: pyrroline-5-carboxylate reductase [Phycisphaerales bacterium]|nr:pyrroline-5-carboxylate reductase [Phycisphaerales bacterium]